MSESAVLRLTGVSFRHYGLRLPLFSEIDLALRQGDRLLITGASGCGKSTLLGIMTALVPRFWPGELKGNVELNYKRPALVLQNPEAQLVTPTVREEIAFSLENRGLPPGIIRAKVDAVLELCALVPLADRHTRFLSGGEAQRLSLACAIAQDPDILFLDEPTAYLDPGNASRFFGQLSDVTDSGSLVVIEHRTEELRCLVNRAVALSQGGLQEISPARACAPFVPAGQLPGMISSEGKRILELSRSACPGHTRAECVSIRFTGVRHSYPGMAPLFEGLEGEAEAGEITAIMGPSGSGKSTLLKKIAGILPTDRGQIWMGSIDLFRSRRNGRHLASRLLYVPQNPEHFFLSGTVGREWEISGARNEEIAAACRLFSLELDPSLSPALLSEGEKRRLNLALAFLDLRPVILLDEPGYGLDRESFGVLAACLRVLKEQGRTLVMVTHSSDLVRLTADRIYVLGDGGWRREVQ